MAGSQSVKRWLPLEANPDVMNQFLWGLGLHEGEAECNDVYGLDEELLAMVPQPVLAVLFLYPVTTESEAERVKEDSVDKEYNKKVYFTQQTVGNACGAAEIVKGIGAKVNPIINFKGYMIGNGITAEEKYDGNALLTFAHGMALISDDLYKEFTASCGLEYYDNDADECTGYKIKLRSAIKDLNIYDILEPCSHDPISNTTQNLSIPDSFKALGNTERPLPVRKRIFGRAWPFELVVKNGRVPSWPELISSLPNDRRIRVPCTSDEVARAWLNDKSVRKAIHAKPVNKIGPWSLCMSLDYEHDTGSMIDYHKNLTSQGFRALIYSGDHDLCVPYTGTQAWTRSLGYKVIDEWRPWMSNDQVAGYTQGYQHNFTFLTIKGAGHTVPEYKPREAFDFYQRWLDGSHI